MMNRFALAATAALLASRAPAFADGGCFDAPAVCDFNAGKALLATDPDAAALKLAAAYRLDHSPDTAVLYAFALQQAHHYALALEAYTDARKLFAAKLDALQAASPPSNGSAAPPPVDPTNNAALDEVRAKLASIDLQLANLAVVTAHVQLRYAQGDAPAGIVIARKGGGDLPSPFDSTIIVNAGSDALIVKYPNGSTTELPISISGGTESTIIVPPPPQPKPVAPGKPTTVIVNAPSHGQRNFGIAVAIIGVVTIGSGVGMGGYASSLWSQAKSDCNGTPQNCATSDANIKDAQQRTSDAKDWLGRAELVSAVGAGIVILGGVIWLTSDRSKESVVHVAPTIGSKTLGLSLGGSF